MIDLDKIDIETLGQMDADELEVLATSARNLLGRIQEQLEWWSAPVGRELQRFYFKEDGPSFYAESVEEGVLINPALPPEFYSTPNEERSPEERARWWNRPYIRIESWEDREKDQRQYREDRKSRGEELEANFEERIAQHRASWFESWPSGKRYDVLCLDGNDWHSPSEWGLFATLEDALSCVREHCS